MGAAEDIPIAAEVAVNKRGPDFLSFAEITEEDTLDKHHGGGNYKLDIVWINVIRMVLLHVAFIVGLYYIISGRASLPTLLFGEISVTSRIPEL